MEELFAGIRQYVDAHHDDMLALWEEMVNTESGSRQLEGVAAMHNIIRRELEAVGAKVQVVPMENAGGVLVAEWNSGSPKAPLLFIGHVDTVFKEGAAKENPFRIDENGFAHGPGVLDMKGGLTIAVFAIKALAAAGFNGRPIKCIFAGDEENMHMFSNAKAVMMEEAKGAAAAFNFETGFMDNRFVVGRKGGGPVKLTVHGVSAHSGNAPEKGRSAILEAAHKIVALEAYNDIPRGRLINCGKVAGGLGENTIPDLCTVNIGVRFPSTEVKNEILTALEQAASHSIVPDTYAELDTSALVECMDTTDGVMALFRHIQRTSVQCGMGEPGCFQVGGLSDSGITVICGVPTVCAMGVRGEGNHTPTEYAEVKSLFERCILTACAACTLEDDFTER